MSAQRSSRKNYVQINQILDDIQTSIRDECHYEERGDFVQASQMGFQTWDHLKKLMILLNVTSLYELEYQTIFDLLSWASTFIVNLNNASRQDPTFFQAYYLFCKEYVTMHGHYLEKDMRNLGSIRRALADCSVRQGDFVACDLLYAQWLRDEPDWGWGWIGWSDSYYLFNGKREKNKERARQLLEQGLAVPHVRDRHHIETRYQELVQYTVLDPC